MLKHLVLKTIKDFKGNPFELKIYSDIFGELTQSYENYECRYLENELEINDEKIQYGDIMSINLNVDIETRIALIETASDYFSAFQIAKGELYGMVLQVLELKHQEFKKTRVKQEKELIKIIKSHLKAKHSKLSSKTILHHLLSNTLGVDKNDTALEKSVLKEIYDNINETIDKLSSVDIF